MASVRGTARQAVLREWQAELAADRWVGIHWPARHGGRDASTAQQVLYHAELARRNAPRVPGNRGLSVTGPSIIVHGTDEQRDRFLSRILDGSELWCTGFSEPEAGSDLANIVGEIDNGWHVARTSLAHEHYTNFLAAQMRYTRSLSHIVEAARNRSSRGTPSTGPGRVDHEAVRPGGRKEAARAGA